MPLLLTTHTVKDMKLTRPSNRSTGTATRQQRENEASITVRHLKLPEIRIVIT